MSSPYASLQFNDFRLFLGTRFFVVFATQFQSVVVAFQVYSLTKDPLSLGFIGLAEALPSIAVSLYAGHLADIIPRKRIIVPCIAILLLCSILLYLYSGDPGYHTRFGIQPIYAIIFLSGVARGFLSPAFFSFMPQLIPREHYANAVTWNSAGWEVATITGLAAGGIVSGMTSYITAYKVDVTLMVLGLLTSVLIASRPVPAHTNEEGIVSKIREGLSFVFRNKLILSAITLDLFAVLFGGAVALLPVFAEEILHVGPQGLGFLRAAPSVGALIMALYLAHNPIRNHTGKILLSSVAGFGVCMILFALSNSFMLSMLFLIVSGALDCVSVIIRGSLLQTLTPENMKGRVSAVNHIFIGSSNEIGMFESGVAAHYLKTRLSVIVGGVITLGVVGITTLKAKTLRNLKQIG